MRDVQSASLILERHLQDHGDHLRQLGLSVWGTATMRTGGDDIAQAFALIGVKPKWANGSHRVMDFEILPMSLLDRPRIDVTLRVSGFFRDAFSNVIKLFDAAVQAVAELDEPEDVNPIRTRIQRETAQLIEQGVDAAHARHQAGHLLRRRVRRRGGRSLRRARRPGDRARHDRAGHGRARPHPRRRPGPRRIAVGEY